MLKVQYASDLHLEYPRNREFLEKNPLAPKGDILILAGDIITDKQRDKIAPLYEKWRGQFRQIISLPGNHEFYGGEVMYCYPNYRTELAPNHILVNNETVVVDHVRFIVSILWTHIPEPKMARLEKASNDYRLIQYYKDDELQRRITAEAVNELHTLSRHFLETELMKPFVGKTVVVTHHLPSYALMGFAAYNDVLKYYCASNLNKLIKENDIDYWIFGHWHQSVQKRMFNTMFVSNPLGYMTEEQHREFLPAAYFEI
ncbi:MAG TPA: metallophosphoesterase [Turneriella sp.]|nr:metallophosphoesterase [Turneriella sp.]